MPTLDEMTEKMRRNISPMYEAPATFWETRVKIVDERLKRAQERATSAATPTLKEFWEKRVERAQRKLNYLRKRAASAKAPGGLRPQEVAERWRKALSE